MKGRSPKRNDVPAWPPILPRTYPSGKSGFQISVMVRGQRIRETFQELEDAETRAAQIRLMRENEGAAAFMLPLEGRVEAHQCAQLLSPYGATLTEAVEHYVERVLKFREAPTVLDAVKRLLAEKEQKNLRPTTLRDLRHRWEAFADEFGDRRLNEVNGEELASWLSEIAPHPVNRHNYRRKVFSLYQLAIKRKWASENIVEQTERPEFDESAIRILSVKQVSALLACADKHGMTAFAALGFFAGVRPDECRLLQWDAINLPRRMIVVGPGVAKVRQQRILPINDTAEAWLAEAAVRAACAKRKVRARIGKPSGLVVTKENFRKRFDAWRTSAGIQFSDWPKDCIRHSFGSYHFAAYGNAVETARLMGHTGLDVFFNHYRALTDEDSAKQFWALRPSTDAAAKIVSIGTV